MMRNSRGCARDLINCVRFNDLRAHCKLHYMKERGRGRPALENARVVVTVRLTPEEKQLAERKARSKGMSFSAFVRKVLQKALDLNW
jgi:predicted HicB family RNase H-like nuclease